MLNDKELAELRIQNLRDRMNELQNRINKLITRKFNIDELIMKYVGKYDEHRKELKKLKKLILASG